MGKLAVQDRGWYPGRQLLSLSRDTFSGSDHPGAASIVVELNQAARGAACIATEPGNHVREYIVDVVIRLASGIYTCAHAFPGP